MTRLFTPPLGDIKILSETGRRCRQLAKDWTSQCGSWPGSSLLLILNLCLHVVDLGLHIVNGVGMSCCFKGGNFAVKGGPNPGPRQTYLTKAVHMSIPSTYPCVHYIFEDFSPCYEVSCWVTYFHSTRKESSNVRLELVHLIVVFSCQLSSQWVFLIKSDKRKLLKD
jgi:hypothetical protein